MMKKMMLLLLVCLSSTVFAQKTKTAKLKATAGNITIRNFNINTVVDDRDDTTSIGSMRAGIANKPAFVNLPNGAQDAVLRFIETYVNQSAETDTIELHLLELDVKESVKGLKEQADLTTKYGFFRNGKKIIEYSSSSYIQTGMDASPYIGRLVSQSIEQVLKEFDNWWVSNRQMFDEAKRNQLTLNVSLETNSTNPDEILYSTSRPLTLSDFKGTPDKLSKALAATYSGFSMRYEMKGDHTGTIANVTIKPYFESSKSWMKPGGKVPYVLQHEQLHFDIATLKAYEFITAIKNQAFTVATFEEQMLALQKVYNKEMEQMQADYDAETSHGIFKNKQNMWQVRIKNELKEKLTTTGR